MLAVTVAPSPAAIAPGTPEVAGNDVDEDCDGVDSCYVDADLDGVYELAITDWSLSTDAGGLSLWPVPVTLLLRSASGSASDFLVCCTWRSFRSAWSANTTSI